MRSVRNILLVLVALIVAIPGLIQAGGGDLLWQDQLHEPGQFTRAHAVVFHRGLVLVGGVTGPESSFGLNQSLLRAYDSSTGALMWENRAEGKWAVGALRIVAHGDHVITVGYLPDLPQRGAPKNRQFVRSHKISTGQILWQSEVQGSDQSPAALALQNGRVFVGGTTAPLTALDADTGLVIWHDPSPPGAFDFVSTVSVDDKRVFAAGRVVKSSLGFDDLFVRAYDVRTGAILWEDVFDRGFEDDPAAIFAHDGRVFVGGWTTSGDLQNRHFVFLVRAYDGKSGALLWQDLFDYAGIGGAALSIVAEGKRVFAAGWVVNDVFKGEDLFLRAYDVASGRVLWQDRLDTGFGDEARVAVAADGRVYVGGTVNTEFVAGGTYQGVVRSYRARNGRLVWEANDIRFPLVDILGLAVGGGRVFAVGGAKGVPSPGLPSSDFFAAAVDAF